jgi:hypothetical protein
MLFMRYATHQLVCLLYCTLCLADSSLSGLPRQIRDLVQLLGQVGLDEFKLCFIAAEELRAGIGIERIRHIDRGMIWGCLGCRRLVMVSSLPSGRRNASLGGRECSGVLVH